MLDEEFQDDNKEKVDMRPLFGIFPCLYCGRCFALKRQLKLHYQEAHTGSIPNYEGRMAGSLLRITNRSKYI
jgi:hypothetical protein